MRSAMTLLLLTAVVAAAIAASPAAAGAPSGERCFAATDQCISEPIRSF